jgi:Tfp pilus assembly protein PilO
MKSLRDLLGPRAVSLGWPGMLGLALLVAIGGFYVSTLAPQQLRIDDLRKETMQLRQRAKQTNSDVPRAPAEKLAAFYGFFPPSKDLPDLLGKVFDAAKRQSLVLEHGEYRALKDSVGGLLRYQFTLPVRGTYPQIRKFVDVALAEVPALSLDSIQFERRKIGDATVDAKLKLVVFLGAGS